VKFKKNVLGWWRARQRAIDVDVLWPAIAKNAQCPTAAREAFKLHARMSRAWDGFGAAELDALIRRLQTPCLHSVRATEPLSQNKDEPLAPDEESS
jgi:hypothetical protein